MLTKKPEEMIVGDVFEKVSFIPYTGTPITHVEPSGQHKTHIQFENGEELFFWNGVSHRMQE